MTDLMKRYEAETDECATYPWHNKEFVTDDLLDWAWEKIQILEIRNAKLKEQLSNQTVEKFQEIIRNQCDEISALKDQLTWRPVSERPKKDGCYFVRVQSPRGDISEDTTTYDKIWGWTRLGRRVVSWLPIPPQ